MNQERTKLRPASHSRHRMVYREQAGHRMTCTTSPMTCRSLRRSACRPGSHLRTLGSASATSFARQRLGLHGRHRILLGKPLHRRSMLCARRRRSLQNVLPPLASPDCLSDLLRSHRLQLHPAPAIVIVVNSQTFVQLSIVSRGALHWWQLRRAGGGCLDCPDPDLELDQVRVRV